jgi:integrase
MTRKTVMKTPIDAGTTITTLQDVLKTVKERDALSVTRRRDLRSAVTRVASLLGDDPARIQLDLPMISAKLATVSPVAAGLTSKTFSNIKCDFVRAVRVSGLKPIQRPARTPLSPEWKKLFAGLSGRRAHIGLSRLARYASADGIEPWEIDDATIEAFITAVRDGTLHRKPNGLHRRVTLIWNEAARQSEFGLQTVEVPSFRSPAKRIEWTSLDTAFRKDVDKHLTWCGGSDVFAADARPRALAPQTIALRRNQIHAAVTALVDSGVKPTAIRSLADLVSPENFKRILRWRYETIGRQENVFNHDLARAMVQIARQWVKVNADVLAELTRLAGIVPMPVLGLTTKNKRALRQFDDPQVLHRLVSFPRRAWAEVKKSPRHDRYILAEAQVALAVGILCYMPMRPQNLAALAFDVHLFLKERPDAVSSLELPASEVKNKIPLAFDIPPRLVKMLIEYRDEIAPKVIGRKPDCLFVNVDGTRKRQSTLAHIISRYLKKREGILLSPHQFRHVSAKVMLNHSPGNFEGVRQLLGHESVDTTSGFYAGIDSRRAARHHQRLIDEILNTPPSGRQRKRGAA